MCTQGPVPQVQSVKHVSPLHLSLGVLPGQIPRLFNIFEFLSIQGNQKSFLGFPYRHHFVLQLDIGSLFKQLTSVISRLYLVLE